MVVEIVGRADGIAPSSTKHNVGNLPAIILVIRIDGNAIKDFNGIHHTQRFNVSFGQSIPVGVRDGDVGTGIQCAFRKRLDALVRCRLSKV